MAEMTFQDQCAFSFLRTNDRGEKPRKVGVTEEVRGPYYSTYGRNHLEDLLRTMDAYIDSFKYAGGSFSLMPRDEVAARFIDELGLERLMFEAAGPEVFAWYVKNYGPEVNLFVDHSQVVQLSGIWGTKDLFGRVLTYKEGADSEPHSVDH